MYGLSPSHVSFPSSRHFYIFNPIIYSKTDDEIICVKKRYFALFHVWLYNHTMMEDRYKMYFSLSEEYFYK